MDGFLSAPRLRRILTLSVPIMLGMMSQTLLNLVDTAFVGSQGDVALAAVGLGSFANFLCVAFLQGLGAGVQATASRRLGEGRREDMAMGLNAALLLGLGLGSLLTAVGWFVAEPLMGLLNDDPAVVEVGGGYLAARFLAIPFVSANFSFRGYWNGTNRSLVYLATLVVMHAVNISLDYVLIYGEFGFPRLGAVGAGYATSISIAVGTLLYVGMALRQARGEGFLRREGLGEAARRVIRLSLPAGMQQTLYAGGFVVFFSIAGSISTEALAASTVLVNLLLVCVLPGLGLGLGGASLVGQALGRGEPADARRWGWEVATLGSGVMGLVGLALALAPRLWLGVFIEEPATLELAVVPLQLLGAAMVLDGIGVVLLNVLVGAGDTLAALILNVAAQWGLFLPLAWLAAVELGYGMNALWGGMVGYRVVLMIGVLWRYRSGRWASVRV